MHVFSSIVGGHLRRLPSRALPALAAAVALGFAVPAVAQDPAPAPGEAAPAGVGPALPAAEDPAVAAPPVQTVDPDGIVVTINGGVITERDLGITAQIMGEQLSQFPQESWREIVIQVAIEFRLIADAAEAAALDDDVNFQTEVTLIRERLLRDDYVERFVLPLVTEDEINAAYQAAIAGMNLPQEVLIRHIMVATEAEANDIILQLSAGADFAQLALDQSLDRATAEVGGLIDAYWAPGELIQEFDDVAFTIPTGEALPFPVAFDGNWHVIQVDDRRLRSPPAFDELRDTLRQQLVAQAYTEAIDALRANADLVVLEAELPAVDPGGEVAPVAPGEAPAPPADGAAAPPAAPGGE